MPIVERDGREGGRGLGRKRRGAMQGNCQPSFNRTNGGGVWVCATAPHLHPACCPVGTQNARSACLTPHMVPGQSAMLQPVSSHPAEPDGFRSLCCNFCQCPDPIPPPDPALSLSHPSLLSLGCGSTWFCWNAPAWRCMWVLCSWDTRGLAAWLRGSLVGETSNCTAVLKPSIEQHRAWFLLSGVPAEPARLPSCCCWWPPAGCYKPHTSVYVYTRESWRCSVLFSDAFGNCICCALSV